MAEGRAIPCGEIARDGQVAFDRLKEITPTVIILDLHIPHISGESILRTIKSSPHLEKIT